ncbi:hypothetical protein L2E82_02935 [Cichorium intybus]|uniref:Uncharacterized protein n=1 Tax=Cichorium intybus TaxID=13427 RepID=A0ACB9H2N1_CICIN|nr:hypothetical protein L2E82_02935 [Cichorium intybus]
MSGRGNVTGRVREPEKDQRKDGWSEGNKENSTGEDRRGSESENEENGKKDTQVEDSVCVLKNGNGFDEFVDQNEAQKSLNEEVNKEVKCNGKETGGPKANSVEHPENFTTCNIREPPLIDIEVPADPSPLHSPLRSDGANTFHNVEKTNSAVEDSMGVGDDSPDCSCSDPQENDVNSLDLNSDPIETIEDQFLKHRNMDRKSKKAKFVTASLKFKDVIRANNSSKN